MKVFLAATFLAIKTLLSISRPRRGPSWWLTGKPEVGPGQKSASRKRGAGDSARARSPTCPFPVCRRCDHDRNV